MSSLLDLVRGVGGIVRVRQFADQVRHRLLFVPVAYVVGGIVLVQLSLALDGRIDATRYPEAMTTTVASSRTVFSAIAGGLISSITLLMSMTLIAIQLASSQFSPRTLRAWLGNRVIQKTIGLLMSTTVFCLLGLRATRDLDSGFALVPHLTVLLAVALGLASLIALVRTVDHVTHNLQISAVTERVVSETIGIVGAEGEFVASAAPLRSTSMSPEVPDDAIVVGAPRSGWVQVVDTETILRELPEGSTAKIVPPLGGHVLQHSPLIFFWPAGDDSDRVAEGLVESIAVGDTRTAQQDVGFGLAQLTDIAVRALSPGINDPRTAMEVVEGIVDILRVIWENDSDPGTIERDGRTVMRSEPDHAARLNAALGPVRRYASTEPDVLLSMTKSLRMLEAEVVRRKLPGPVAPLRQFMSELAATADDTGWSQSEKASFDRLLGETPPH